MTASVISIFKASRDEIARKIDAWNNKLMASQREMDQIIAARHDELLALIELNGRLLMDDFNNTGGKISRCNTGFSDKVKIYYEAAHYPDCWCLLTNDVLPKQTVVGAHLFKHHWIERSGVMGFDEIQRPKEWAASLDASCMGL